MSEHGPVDETRLRAIFGAALDRPAEERASFTRDACGTDETLRRCVEAMLAEADRQTHLRDSPTEHLDGGDAAPADRVTFDTPAWRDEGTDETPGEQAGDRIGPYKLLQLIGEGGFGTVWMAEQTEPVKRRVALKVIKLGMDTRQVIARFEAERQALALMDHPNIARVLDAGSTAVGRPYFVMEYIRGVPILEYCDTERLDTTARLGLFTQVCHAIRHAHQKGIIHRDIKPSNVLVTMHDGTPVPKVIDFGIAKATNQDLTQKTLFTEHRQMIGTPAYMSPEQAEMSGLDVDTRSDIYSLGVLLYELLTGTTPFDTRALMASGYAEMMRVIREETPHKPSTRLSSLGATATRTAAQRHEDPQRLGLILRGDLDWIVMKCLEKDRTRRYETANALAEDIQRHLLDEPVLAGPPSTSYRMRKFVRRNRTGVLAVSAVGLAMVLGLIGTAAGMAWAVREKDRAQHELVRTREVQRFVTEMLGSVNPEVAQGRDTALMRTILEGAAARLDAGEVEDEEIEAELRATIGETYVGLGEYELAEPFLRRALAARRRAHGPAHPETIAAATALGSLLQRQGRWSEAEELYDEALASARTALGEDDPITLGAVNNMGSLLQRQGRLEDAEPYYREAMDGCRRVLGADHEDTLTAMSNLGHLLRSQGRLDEAETLHREALEGRRRTLGGDHPDTLTAQSSMGSLLRAQGRPAEAEPYYREVMAARQRILGDDHPDTLTAIDNMGLLLSDLDRLREAESFYRTALDARRRVLGDDHQSTLTSISNVGYVLQAQGLLSEAEPYLDEALEGRRTVLGPDHPNTLSSINNMGSLLQAQGRLAAAEPYFREAMESRRRVLGPDHPNALIAESNLALLLADLDRGEQALRLAQDVVDRARTALGSGHWFVGNFLGKRGRAEESLDRFSDAERSMLEAHRILVAALGEDHEQTRRVTGYLANLYSVWDEAAPNQGHRSEALEWRDRLVNVSTEAASDETGR